jgi:hypothetical protein
VNDYRERVVLFEEELPRVVEPDRAAREALAHILRAPDYQSHRLFPVRLDELPFAADERHREARFALVRLPAVQPLRPEPPMVDAVYLAPAHPDYLPAAHADV